MEIPGTFTTLLSVGPVYAYVRNYLEETLSARDSCGGEDVGEDAIGVESFEFRFRF